jgi:hypothetical protein
VDFFLPFLLYGLFLYSDVVDDPVHSAWLGQTEARRYECERLSQAEAHRRYPARVPPTNARSSAIFEIDALACQARVVEDGARSPRDEVILHKLSDDVAELTALAAKSVDADTTWIVDAYYPDPNMVRKIAGASRVALAERGQRVSDAPPRFTAGDVEVLRTLPMREAIPHACRRWYALRDEPASAAGMAGGSDEGGRARADAIDKTAFLAVALLHAHESQLHAGVCQRGEFRWLR